MEYRKEGDSISNSMHDARARSIHDKLHLCINDL